jgi:uncharacterized protein DUF3224
MHIFSKAAAALALIASAATQTQAQSPAANTQGPIMTTVARGAFDVKLKPLTPYNQEEDAKFMRMSLDKQFQGDLEAVSHGEMLAAGTAGTDPKGSGGYVAIEHVAGSLNGRKGTFSLQHNATMTHGEPYLNIIVIPDSGTGELAGLAGKMNIIIAKGKHSYEFDYSLPAKP